MKFYKYILASALTLALSPAFVSCGDDELGETIFPDVTDTVDPNSATYKFDTWLNQNFRDIYNLSFCYKMIDVEADMNYNLVPASFDKARDLALLTKYLWFDSYKELATEEFLKEHGPRIIHLIGSPAYNPQTGTIILGLAEGGIKVSLFRVNDLDVNDFAQLNEYYFRTMHHEFAHIMHQTKSYPTEFNTLSNGRYDQSNWQDRNGGIVTSLGFITNYASSETREDFAETIANYVTRTDEQDQFLLWCADQNWFSGDDETDQSIAYCYYYYKNEQAQVDNDRTYTLRFVDDKVRNLMTVVDDKKNSYSSIAEVEAYIASMEAKGFKMYPYEISDEVDGRAIIEQKRNIARNWFKDEWGISFDSLRSIVQYRQENFDIEALRQEIENIQ
jgi:substrate import-associated zinc metallohydrolase lipoprotein